MYDEKPFFAGLFHSCEKSSFYFSGVCQERKLTNKLSTFTLAIEKVNIDSNLLSGLCISMVILNGRKIEYNCRVPIDNGWIRLTFRKITRNRLTRKKNRTRKDENFKEVHLLLRFFLHHFERA
ncbi:hypothetical protein KIH13_16990 [Pseudomonas viridiflava]|nr:hypothetical protein KIH13_16990 [Pseudomonas viridiflava]